jgi:cytochrome d oxidase subunit CydB
MTAMEPSALALFWAAVIAGAIVVYVILDGFDLGVGILFGTTRDAALRKGMMDAISPFWDGNETWLVVIGASLFAAFPVVYAVFLPAFYIPVLLLLFGLIFRGVAFEFRYRGSARGLWDWGFFLGSTIAAFVQGAAVGAMIRGIPVADGQYAGRPLRVAGAFAGGHWHRPRARKCVARSWLARHEVRGRATRMGTAEGAPLGHRRARCVGSGCRGVARRAGSSDR